MYCKTCPKCNTAVQYPGYTDGREIACTCCGEVIQEERKIVYVIDEGPKFFDVSVNAVS